jgi:hypothetical protein
MTQWVARPSGCEVRGSSCTAARTCPCFRRAWDHNKKPQTANTAVCATKPIPRVYFALIRFGLWRTMSRRPR